MPKIILTPTAGKVKELCDLLRKELQVPETAISFSVHFNRDEPIVVDCSYFPKVEDD